MALDFGFVMTKLTRLVGCWVSLSLHFLLDEMLKQMD